MKVLFIGLGGIGQRHLRNLLFLTNNKIDLYAWRVKKNRKEITNSLTLEKSSNIEKKYNIKIFSSLNKALKIKPSITFICNPSSMHIKPAILAVKSGSHVFIEKPLSNSVNGIKELIKESKKRKKVVYVGFQLRFNPVIKKLKETIEKEEIGNILGVRSEVAEFMPGFHKYENYQNSYASKKHLGGGVILTQIHEIDYLQWIFGIPKRVFALGGKYSNLKINVEDCANILIESRLKKKDIPISIYMDYLQKDVRRICYVYGSEGRIEADLKNLTLKIIKEKNKKKQFQWKNFNRNEQFIEQLKHFLNVIKTKEKPLVDLREGTKSLEIALAAKKSLVTKKIKTIIYS